MNAVNSNASSWDINSSKRSEISSSSPSIDPSIDPSTTHHVGVGVGRATKLDIQSALSIFNTVVSPIMCLLVDGSNCFLHAFTPNETVTSTAFYKSCHVTDFTGNCVQLPHELSSTFSAPFLYSYQCSAEFIRNYAMVFVFMYVYLVIVGPVIHFILAFVYLKTPKDHASYHLSDRLVEAFYSLSLLKKRASVVPVATSYRSDVDIHVKQNNESSSTETNIANTTTNTTTTTTTSSTTTGDIVTTTSNPTTSSNKWNSQQIQKKVFTYLMNRCVRVDKTSSKLIVDLSVLVTFGIAYVPLGCIVCISMFITCLEWRTVMSRCCILYDECEQFRYRTTFQPLRCEGVIDNFERFQWVLVTLLCWFFSFFLYDYSAGDLQQGSWATIVIAFWPLVLWFITYVKRMYYPKVNFIHSILTKIMNLVAVRTPTTTRSPSTTDMVPQTE